MRMNRKRTHRRERGLAALLALLLSLQAIAWVSHAVEHGGWHAGASGASGASVEARQAAPAGSRDDAHLHGGPFARCGACDALAQLQGAAPPAWIGLGPVRAALPELPEPGAIEAHRILARATARGPPSG